MPKAAYIRLNTSDLRKKLEEMGFTYSGYGDIQKATNICTTSHKTYSCIPDYLIDEKDPFYSWSLCRENCGKDIERFLELCKDEMDEITKVPANIFNK